MSLNQRSSESALRSLFRKAAISAIGVFLISGGIAFGASPSDSVRTGFVSQGVDGFNLPNPTQKLFGEMIKDKSSDNQNTEERLQKEESETQTFSIDGEDRVRSSVDENQNKIEKKSVFNLKKPNSKAESLKHFGYDMFNQSNYTVSGKVSISDSYLVGPGDVFHVGVWGSEDASFTTQISANGDFLMPNYGFFNANGLSFSGLKIKINEVISEKLTGFDLSVVPVKPRKNNVFVVGEVHSPGVYGLEGGSTALTSLMAAGGPTLKGSLRKIEVRRGKKLVGKFDVYDFLTKGDRSGDVDLRDGDTVFVPLAGSRVYISGAVKRPAIYELTSKEMTLGEALEISGGIIPTADLQKIQIQRLIAHKEQIIFSREISRKDSSFSGNSTPVQDLDAIRVFSISPREKQMISLEGHVFEAGPRPFKEGIMLSEILSSANMLKKNPALDYGEILREGGLGGEYQVVSFNPGKILEGDKNADIELKAKDRIVIFPLALMKDSAMVSVTGHVITPGTMPFTPGMRIKDLIYRSGGLKNGVSLSTAELSRRSIKNGELVLTRIEVDLGKAMNDDSRHNLEVEPFDSLMVKSVPEWKIDNYITLKGEFKYPGRYSFQPGEKLSSVIKRAQGFGQRAYLKAGVFTRLSVKDVQKKNKEVRLSQLRQEQSIETEKSKYYIRSYDSETQARKFAIEKQSELELALERTQPEGRVVVKLDDLEKFSNSRFDVVLEPGDELFIPSRPSSVMIEGAVYNSMGILWENNKSLRYYLNRVGGVTKTGDLSNTYLIRADGTVVSRNTSGRGFIDKTFAEPGDTIFVPTKIRVPVDRWQRSMDILKTVSSLLITVYTIDRWNN